MLTAADTAYSMAFMRAPAHEGELALPVDRFAEVAGARAGARALVGVLAGAHVVAAADARTSHAVDGEVGGHLSGERDALGECGRQLGEGDGF
jgi:hypothetical protein